MLELAVEIGVDAVLFQMMDPVPGKTDVLLLDSTQRRWLLGEIARLEPRIAELQRKGSPTRIEGFQTFLDRLTSTGADEGRYDAPRIAEIPCVTGWVFARIVAGGEFHSCLKSACRPVGDVLREGLRALWYSPAQEEFRRLGVSEPRTHPYYAPIGCMGSCDNLDYNQRYGVILRRTPRWLSRLLRFAIATPRGSAGRQAGSRATESRY